jgi:hypothetical protein
MVRAVVDRIYSDRIQAELLEVRDVAVAS